MCQLLGMNCNVPTDVVFSFTGFAERGGHTDEHVDGWGIAFFEGAGLRHFVDHCYRYYSAFRSKLAICPIKSSAARISRNFMLDGFNDSFELATSKLH